MIDIDQIRINFNPNELHTLNIALAIIMFGIALDIKLDDFKRLIKKPKIVLVGILSQFVLLPLLTFILVLIFKPHPSIALGMILVAACPGGNVSNFFSKLAGANAALSVSLTAFATLLSVIMTPLNFELYGSMYGPTKELLKTIHLDPIRLARLVAIILGIPIVLGMLLGHYFPVISSKVSKILKPLSMVFFIVLVVLAFKNNWDLFLKHIHLVLWLVLIHNFAAFLLGYSTASAFNLQFPDRKTITIETGIQNSGLGLLLIFGFFQGLGGMALFAAFWGIWHIISGMTLATYWGRKSK